MISLKAGNPVLKNIVISQHGGNHAGTWVHPQVAVHLARRANHRRDAQERRVHKRHQNVQSWKHYFSNESTKIFLHTLVVGNPTTDIFVKSSRVRGVNGGTWVHPQVAVHLAAWISPEFAVAVTRLVTRYTDGNITTAESNAASIAISNRVTVVADAPTIRPQFRLTSVTGFIDLRIAQVYTREVLGRFKSLHPHGRPGDALTLDQMSTLIVLKFGSQGEQTGRQGAHTQAFRDSKLVDSFPTRGYAYAEQRMKDILYNRGQLYEGLHEDKTVKDTELFVLHSQEDYAMLVELIQTCVGEAEANSTSAPVELLLAMEKTKQVEAEARKAEAEARKAEAEASVKKAEIDFEIMKFRGGAVY